MFFQKGIIFAFVNFKEGFMKTKQGKSWVEQEKTYGEAMDELCDFDDKAKIVMAITSVIFCLLIIITLNSAVFLVWLIYITISHCIFTYGFNKLSDQKERIWNT